MVTLSIVGASNSGKTTLLEDLIWHFSELGLKVATVKHTSHDHAFDREGKDSFRHRQAGAMMTLVSGSSETALFAGADPKLNDRLREMLESESDIILIEGDKFSDCDKVLLTRHVERLSDPKPVNLIASYGPKRPESATTHFELDDISGLANFLTSRYFPSLAGVTRAE
jgi:molybdopterin-guanine dinucleotide biosynthesis protein B